MSSRSAARAGIPAHIAMVGATTPSHVYPSLGLIRELCARGHRVTYVIGEGLAALVRRTGAEVIACTTVLPAEDDREGWPADPIEAMALFLDEGMQVLPQMMRAYGPDRPDLVLHDIGGLAGPVGHEIFHRVHAGWRYQASAVRQVLADQAMHVWVAESKGTVVAFVAATLHSDRRIGEISMLAVEPGYQRGGLGSALTEFATDGLRRAGMQVAMVETGGDWGHDAARHVYENAGYAPLPVARYFKSL